MSEDRCENFRNLQKEKVELQEAKDYSAPSNEKARKQEKYMSSSINSEMIGNDR